MTTDADFESLGPREREILALFPKHAAYKNLAYALGISEQTVKNHVSSIIAKLGVENFCQAAILFDRRSSGGWEAAVEGEIGRRDEADLVQAYRYIARTSKVPAWPPRIYDHACAACDPDGDMAVEGFVCVPHRAAAFLEGR